MKLILARTQALAATAVVLGLLTMLPGRTEMLPRRAVSVEPSPDGVPCHLSKNYPGGTWEISLPRTSGLPARLTSIALSRPASESKVTTDSSTCRRSVPRKVAWGWEA
jgi:hypothetical protein